MHKTVYSFLEKKKTHYIHSNLVFKRTIQLLTLESLNRKNQK